jgi:hypothetical protein
MKVDFSLHALERMTARGITKSDVLDVVKDCDFIEEQDETAIIYSKIITKKNKKYIYRVFVNRTFKPAKVITVYGTFKIEKYGY